MSDLASYVCVVGVPLNLHHYFSLKLVMMTPTALFYTACQTHRCRGEVTFLASYAARNVTSPCACVLDAPASEASPSTKKKSPEETLLKSRARLCTQLLAVYYNFCQQLCCLVCPTINCQICC